MDLSVSDQIIHSRLHRILPHLDERQRRLYLGAEADSLGWGGKSKISLLSGVCRDSIAKGVVAVKQENTSARIRKKGAGRKRASEKYPDLLNDINEIISPHTMGNPCNPLIWSSKSASKVQKALQEKDYQISHEATILPEPVNGIKLSIGFLRTFQKIGG